MEPALVSEQEIELYYKNGFVLKRDLFTATEKENLIKCADEIQSWPEAAGKWLQYFDYNSNNQRILARTENFVPYIGDVFSTIREKLLCAAGEILGEECKIYKDKIIYKFPGSHGFATHQDGAGYLHYELRPHIIAMISVDRADKTNGCLQVIRGFPFNDSGDYEPELDAELLLQWDRDKRWEYIETEPGDVFLFGMHVPHRSDANSDPVKTRRTFYLTLNRASEGECREKYFKAKRMADPPEIERSVSNRMCYGTSLTDQAKICVKQTTTAMKDQVRLIAFVASMLLIVPSLALKFAWIDSYGLELDAPGLAPRLAHQVVEDSKGNLWLFGGLTFGAWFDEVWKMEVRTNMTWKQIIPSSIEKPLPRAHFCLIIDKNDNLFLYGGYRLSDSYEDVVYSDMWLFNTTSLAWKQLRSDNSPLVKGEIGRGDNTTHPGPRSWPMCWYDKWTNQIWLHGAKPLPQQTADVWSYSIDTDIWTLRIDRYNGSVTTDSIDPVNDWTRKNVTIAMYIIGQMFTTDLDGNLWTYYSDPIRRYMLKFDPRAVQWIYISPTTPISPNTKAFQHGAIGEFSVNYYPPDIKTGAMTYIGNNILRVSSGDFVTNGLRFQVWHYNMTSSEWALMYGPEPDTTVLTYGAFQQLDDVSNPGGRSAFGYSHTTGNIWYVCGSVVASLGGYNPNDTFVLPVDKCDTDINPCSADAMCTDHLGWTECGPCNEGFEGDGYTCTAIPQPIRAPMANQPVNSVVPTNAPTSRPLPGSVVSSGTQIVLNSIVVIALFSTA